MKSNGQTKTCSQCKESKPIDVFCKDSSKPDKKHPVCKACQKINRKKTAYHSSQAHNRRMYKNARKKSTHVHHKCLGYTPDGTPCKTKPERGYFCERCRNIKQGKGYYHYTEDDFPVTDLKKQQGECE